MKYLTLDELIESLLDLDEEFCSCGKTWNEHSGGYVSPDDAFDPRKATL
jgi:hypothetical protein